MTPIQTDRRCLRAAWHRSESPGECRRNAADDDRGHWGGETTEVSHPVRAGSAAASDPANASQFEVPSVLRSNGSAVFWYEGPVRETGAGLGHGGVLCRTVQVSRITTMDDFPDFMKNPFNRIAKTSQATQGVEGYVFDGTDGSQMAFWTCAETASSDRKSVV